MLVNIIIVISTLLFAVIFAAIKTTVSIIFKFKFLTKINQFLYFTIIYIITVFVFLSSIIYLDFIQQLIVNKLTLIIYLTLLILFEVVLTYYLFFRYKLKKEYIKFALYSYVAILLSLLLNIFEWWGINLY